MIWISTLCLLAVAAWLLFNALNERRWVEAHSHDETVASDPGLFPSLTALTGSGTLDSEGKPIDQENTAIARAVTSVKEKTSKYGDKFIEAKKAAGNAVEGEASSDSVNAEDSSFGRAVAKVGAMTGHLNNKIDKTIKVASERTSKFGATEGSDETLLTRVSRKVSASTENLGDVVVARAKSATQGVREKTAASRENGVLGKVTSTVATGVNKLEAKIDSRATAASDGSAPKDLLSRVASKVSKKVNEFDNKSSANMGKKVNEIDAKASTTIDKTVSGVEDKVAKPATEIVD